MTALIDKPVSQACRGGLMAPPTMPMAVGSDRVVSSAIRRGRFDNGDRSDDNRATAAVGGGAE